MAITGVDRLRAKLQRIPVVMRDNLKRAIASSALLLDRSMKASIQHGPKTGRLYRRSSSKRRTTRAGRSLGLRRIEGGRRMITGANFHRASAPGEAPATDTGRLVSSISPQFHEGGLVATVGVHDVARVRYARHLEFGTRRMRPRPFVRPAFMQHKAEIQTRLHEAVQRSVRGRAG